MTAEGHETGRARPPAPRYPGYDQDLFRDQPVRNYGETLPKQTTRPERPASWPDYAPERPKQRPKQRNPWPALVAVMLVLGVGCGGAAFLGLRYMQSQSAQPVQKDAKAATAVDSATAVDRRPRAVALGKPARDGDFAFKVTRISTGGSQTFVRLVVKNTSTEAQTLVPSIQQVRGAAGRTYPAYAAAGSALSTRLWVSLAPGKAVAGVMVFPAGTAAKPQAVELHGSIGSTGILVKPLR